MTVGSKKKPLLRGLFSLNVGRLPPVWTVAPLESASCTFSSTCTEVDETAVGAQIEVSASDHAHCFLCHASRDYPTSSALTSEPPSHLVDGPRLDERAVGGAGVGAVAQPEFLDRRHQLLDKLVVHAFLHRVGVDGVAGLGQALQS